VEQTLVTAKQSLPLGIIDVLGGLPLFVTAPLHRGQHLRWGATDGEISAPMPGDDLLPKASFNGTRAITIAAPPEMVWPWIVQMGYGRAGWYTYDLLDNGGHVSADEVLAEFQNVQIGDWVPMAKEVNETTAFRVKAFETGSWLLWDKPDSTWAWKLTPISGGGTRLTTRLKCRYQWESPAMAMVSLVLLEFGDFPMIRRVLKGVKARAERMNSLATGAASGATPKM
jgi:hypothetical protein